MGLVALVILICMGAIAFRTFMLMTVDREELISYAVKDEIVSLPARRGDILSDDGTPLATSITFYDIHIDMHPSNISDTLFTEADSLAVALSNLFKDKSSAEYRRLLNLSRDKNKRYLLIHRRATYEEVLKLKSFPIFHHGGCIEEERPERLQLLDGIGRRTIGQFLIDSATGYSGIEMYFNSELKGSPGVGLKRRVAGSRVTTPVTEPENGMDIVTTLNVSLQDIVSKALFDGMVQQRAERGCAILMEVKTGDIKAMANLSSSNGTYAEIENMAIGHALELGSVMKTASAIALFESERITPFDTVYLGGKGEYTFGGRTIRDSEGHSGMDEVTFKNLYKYSLNGMSKVVFDNFGSDPTTFLDYWYDNMHLNEIVGITLPGEASPVIMHPTRGRWDKNFPNLPWISIGYSSQLTPLQLCAFYNGIANGGQRMKPRLVSEIMKDGKVVHRYPTEKVGGKMYGRKTAAYLDTIMLAVVEEEGGTAHRIYTENYRIAGKTGTAYKSQGRAGYGNDAVCSFVGFFPADNPRYTCAVVVEHPKVNSSGGGVSAPIFREIADNVVAIMAHESDFGENVEPIAETPPEVKGGLFKDIALIARRLGITLGKNIGRERWVSVTTTEREGEEQQQLTIAPVSLESGVVPDVRGMGLRDAIYLLEREGLHVSVTGSGKVRTQSVNPGEPVVAGRNVHLTLR